MQRTKLKSYLMIPAIAVAFLVSNAQASDTLPKIEIFPNITALAQGVVDGPPAASTGLYIASTIIGLGATGVPCFGGNYGCGPVGSIAIPYPQLVIKGGSQADIVTMLQDLNFTGTPTVTVTATQGTTTIYTGTAVFTSPLGPGYVASCSFPISLPATKGPVTVFVQATSGTTVLASGSSKFSID